MSFHIPGSVMGAGLAALAMVTVAQTTSLTANGPNLQLAQATLQPGPVDAKTAKKTKKQKSGQGAGNSAAGSGQPAPHVGPPDPGKY